MADLFLNDVGTALRLTVTESNSAVDVSTAATKQIKLRKPTGEVLVKSATFPNGGADGLMQYVTIAGDLDVAGRWRIQGYLASVGGWTGHTSEATFHVRQTVSG